MFSTTNISSDYTSRPRINDNVKEFFYEKIASTSLLPRVDQSPITFTIPSIDGLFIDPNQIFMNVTLRVKKKNAGAWVDLAGDPVAPYNYFFYTLFSELEVEFNNELLDSTKYNYQLQTYLKLLLNTNQSMRSSILSNVLYGYDKAGAFNLSSNANATLNPGSYSRAQKINNSAIVEMRGQVISNVLELGRPIIDNISITLRFFPNEPNKCLIHTKAAAADPMPSYQIEIINAQLYVGRIRPKIKNIQTAIYPFVKQKVQRHIHPAAIQEFGPITIASGNLPQRCWVVMVTEEEFLGSYIKNRLNFQNFKLGHISVIQNGNILPFKEGFNPDFTSKHYSDCYFALLHESGKGQNNFNIPIDYGDYDSGYLVVWDLTANHSLPLTQENQYSEPSVGGLLQLKAHFDTAPTVPHTLLCAASKSGKTSLIKQMATQSEHTCENFFTKIVWCSGSDQPVLFAWLKERIPNITILDYFPGKQIEDRSMFDPDKNNLCIVDDLMEETSNDPVFSKMFTKYARHMNICFWCLHQNLYNPSCKFRTSILRNVDYLILFGNPRDAFTIRCLASQIYPNRTNYLIDAYSQATAKPYGWLLIDFMPHTPENYRLRQGILENEGCFIFVPKTNDESINAK